MQILKGLINLLYPLCKGSEVTIPIPNKFYHLNSELLGVQASLRIACVKKKKTNK